MVITSIHPTCLSAHQFSTLSSSLSTKGSSSASDSPSKSSSLSSSPLHSGYFHLNAGPNLEPQTPPSVFPLVIHNFAHISGHHYMG
jgi:hypothetical protein